MNVVAGFTCECSKIIIARKPNSIYLQAQLVCVRKRLRIAKRDVCRLGFYEGGGGFGETGRGDFVEGGKRRLEGGFARTSENLVQG